MFERIIYALLYLLGLALCYWLVIYVLGVVGLHLPPHVPEIIMAMFVLIAVLILYRLFFIGVNIRW